MYRPRSWHAPLVALALVMAGCSEHPDDGLVAPQFAKPGAGGGGGGGGGSTPPAGVQVIDLTPAGSVGNPQNRAFGTGVRAGVVLGHGYLAVSGARAMRITVTRDGAGSTSASAPEFLPVFETGRSYGTTIGYDGRLFGSDGNRAGYFTESEAVLLPFPQDAEGTWVPAVSAGPNRSGTVVGASVHPERVAGGWPLPYWRATLWEPNAADYTPVLLPVLRPGSAEREQATGIAGNGVVAGYSYDGKQGSVAFVARPDGAGGYQLEQLAGRAATASGMSDGGIVIGTVGNSAVRWLPVNGTYGAPQLLPSGGEDGSTPAAINDAGDIAGERAYKSRNTIRRVAVLWRCNASVAVELPPVAGYTSSSAEQIDDDGYVIGRSWGTSGSTAIATATLWDVSKLPPC